MRMLESDPSPESSPRDRTPTAWFSLPTAGIRRTHVRVLAAPLWQRLTPQRMTRLRSFRRFLVRNRLRAYAPALNYSSFLNLIRVVVPATLPCSMVRELVKNIMKLIEQMSPSVLTRCCPKAGAGIRCHATTRSGRLRCAESSRPAVDDRRPRRSIESAINPGRRMANGTVAAERAGHEPDTRSCKPRPQ